MRAGKCRPALFFVGRSTSPISGSRPPSQHSRRAGCRNGTSRWSRRREPPEETIVSSLRQPVNERAAPATIAGMRKNFIFIGYCFRLFSERPCRRPRHGARLRTERGTGSDRAGIESAQFQITAYGLEVVVVRVVERRVDLALGGPVADAVHQHETAVGSLLGKIGVGAEVDQ